jgi:cytochrome P450
MEMQLIISMIAQRYQLQLADWKTVEPVAILTIRPRHVVRMRLVARQVCVPLRAMSRPTRCDRFLQ